MGSISLCCNILVFCLAHTQVFAAKASTLCVQPSINVNYTAADILSSRLATSGLQEAGASDSEVQDIIKNTFPGLPPVDEGSTKGFSEVNLFIDQVKASNEAMKFLTETKLERVLNFGAKLGKYKDTISKIGDVLSGLGPIASTVGGILDFCSPTNQQVISELTERIREVYDALSTQIQDGFQQLSNQMLEGFKKISYQVKTMDRKLQPVILSVVAEQHAENMFFIPVDQSSKELAEFLRYSGKGHKETAEYHRERFLKFCDATPSEHNLETAIQAIHYKITQSDHLMEIVGEHLKNSCSGFPILENYYAGLLSMLITGMRNHITCLGLKNTVINRHQDCTLMVDVGRRFKLYLRDVHDVFNKTAQSIRPKATVVWTKSESCKSACHGKLVSNCKKSVSETGFSQETCTLSTSVATEENSFFPISTHKDDVNELTPEPAPICKARSLPGWERDGKCYISDDNSDVIMEDQDRDCLCACPKAVQWISTDNKACNTVCNDALLFTLSIGHSDRRVCRVLIMNQLERQWFHVSGWETGGICNIPSAVFFSAAAHDKKESKFFDCLCVDSVNIKVATDEKSVMAFQETSRSVDPVMGARLEEMVNNSALKRVETLLPFSLCLLFLVQHVLFF